MLAEHFDEVRVIPCGPRPDKPELNTVPPVFRAALCDITFRDIDRVTVDLFDLEQDTFTRNHALEEIYAPLGEVWHVVGADWLAGGADGQSAVQTGWEKGPEMWLGSRFAVLTRPGHELDTEDLPPQHEFFPFELEESSTKIRDLLLYGQQAGHLLDERAHNYIERYGLYRGTNPATWSRGSLSDAHCLMEIDSRNAKAIEWGNQLTPHTADKDPDFIAAIGGDGTMLRAIREHWRKRVPFFGINAGHLGFLMNAPEQVLSAPFPPQDVIFRQLPLLYVEIETDEGSTHSTYAFNDAWVERATSLSAWLEIHVNGIPRLPRLVSDGALVSTAAGSTAYARSMGASPLLADTPAWLLVGSNVMEPANWKSALLSTDAYVEIKCLEPQFRPVSAYVDGIAQGKIRSLRARLSRAATVEIAFLSNRDMAEKIAAIQFMR